MDGMRDMLLALMVPKIVIRSGVLPQIVCCVAILDTWTPRSRSDVRGFPMSQGRFDEHPTEGGNYEGFRANERG